MPDILPAWCGLLGYGLMFVVGGIAIGVGALGFEMAAYIVAMAGIIVGFVIVQISRPLP